MSVSREEIDQKIYWFNQEVERFKALLCTWIQESGHEVEMFEEEVTKVEELSGPYNVKQYTLLIDRDIRISIKPFGIWLIGAKGRIDVSGPSGSEKFVFLSIGGPGVATEAKNSSGRVIEKAGRSVFKNVDEENWYWYDDSSYRNVSKFSKEIVEPLLERLQ